MCRIFVMKLTGSQWWSELSRQQGRACSLTWRRPRDHMTSINTSMTSSPQPRRGGRSLKRRQSFTQRRQGREERGLNHLSTAWLTSRLGWANSTALFMRSFWSGFPPRPRMKSLLTTEQHSGWAKLILFLIRGQDMLTPPPPLGIDFSTPFPLAP